MESRRFVASHRAGAAFRALALRCSAVKFRAFPPSSPPSLPDATAAAFFFRFAIPDSCHQTAHLESYF
jgi:hypothetical protein